MRLDNPRQKNLPLDTRIKALVALAGLCLAATLLAPLTSAGFADTTDNTGNFFSSDVLDPSTAVVAWTGGAVVLNWVPTDDSYADGYHVFRSSTAGGPYAKIADSYRGRRDRDDAVQSDDTSIHQSPDPARRSVQGFG